MVAYINNEIIVAPSDGTLIILNDDLGVKKFFKNGISESTPFQTIFCLSGNEKFVATGDAAGVLRYFRRYGVSEAKV